MKATDCNIVSREIDELDRGQLPSLAVSEHTQVCAKCRTFYDDRLKLRQMVAGLEAVEAPADFEFRLRARLASEQGKGASRFSPGIFKLGLPAVALATVAMLVGAGLLMRVFVGSTNHSPVAQNESPRVAEPAKISSAISSQGVQAAKENVPDASGERANSLTIRREQGLRATGQLARATAGNRSRVATKDFSSNPAEVLKRDDLLAGTETVAMFPLEASEPLRVSVDYATGGSRTISLPSLSFGSQQVVSRGTSMMKTSARTVW